MVDLINAGSDNDTLAGTLVADLTNGVGVPFDANDTIRLTQGNYYTGQVAFMDEPVVTIGNASGGEAASVTIGQPNTDSEVTLFEYDGLGGNLNAENVLFLGGSGMNNGVVTNADNSRSILETAAVDGGALNGSDALILDTMADADTLATDFSLHGDDLLFTGAGDDVVTAGTGDDRIFGSVGTDTVDGGKDLYVIQTLVAGEVVESVETLNAYDADQRLAAADVTAVALLEEDRTAGA
jgi:Ca2+-binding RTX toxin-like protein